MTIPFNKLPWAAPWTPPGCKAAPWAPPGWSSSLWASPSRSASAWGGGGSGITRS